MKRQETEADLKGFLAKVPLFLGAPDRALEIATSAVRKRVYESGTTVFQEGDKGEALYIIASGLVKLSKVDLGGHEKTLAILQPPEFFGEMALLGQASRSATAVTLNVVGVTVPPEEIGTPLDLAYQALVSSFQEANPNVSINVIEQPPEFETQVMVDLAAGTAPDVWRAGQGLLPELIQGDYLLDAAQCAEYAPDLTFDRFLPNILAIHQPEGPDGPTYGVPNGFTPMVFYYNPESFERAGIQLAYPTRTLYVERSEGAA